MEIEIKEISQLTSGNLKVGDLKVEIYVTVQVKAQKEINRLECVKESIEKTIEVLKNLES